MAIPAGHLVRLLQQLGLKIEGLQMLTGDKATWKPVYATDATSQERAAVDAALLSFDPEAPLVKDAQQTAAAQTFADQQFAKAGARFQHYKTNGEDVPYDDKMADADTALWQRCWKEAAS